MWAHALCRVALSPYLINPKNSTHVISANAINNVLWPHRATVPSMFQSPKFTCITPRHLCVSEQVLCGGGTVHFQSHSRHVASHKIGHFRAFLRCDRATGRTPADLTFRGKWTGKKPM